MNLFVLWFVKITGVPIEPFYLRRKTYYLNKKAQSKRIKGRAMIIANHIDVFDYALYLYTFFFRTLYFLAAELLWKKGKLGSFISKIGAVKVDRDNMDFSFMNESIDLLEKNKVLLMFPESRLRRKGEEDLDFLDFKPSYVYIALNSETPIIPIYSDGGFKRRKRTNIIIGEKIYLNELYDSLKSEKENIDFLNNYVKDYIKSLKEELEKRLSKNEKK